MSLSLGWKIQSGPYWLKIGPHGILEVLILNQDLDFWNSNPFLSTFGPRKSKFSIFPENWHTWYLNDVDSYSNILKPKSILGQIWAKKIEVVHFAWKLALVVYRGCWFLFWHYFSQFPTLNPLSILTENWHIWYIKDADSYSEISFWNIQP